MKSEICLIGDIVLDVTLKSDADDIKLRLGGIIHAARALWAMDIAYDLAYFAPSYLDEQINSYLTHHGCINIFKLGNVTGAPNVFLIGEPKEAGPQEYEFLLRDDLKVAFDQAVVEEFYNTSYSDYIVISGNFDLVSIVNRLQNNVHVDVANNTRDIQTLQKLTRKINTLFISTSSDIFKNYFINSFPDFAEKFEKYCDTLILKENRGGSRIYDFHTKETLRTFSQPRKIMHSVGVGDVYDTIYVSSKYSNKTTEESMTLSSWIAAEYAVTSFPDDFKKGVGRVLKSQVHELVKMQGVSLPWEMRSTINIYIAAPDFSFVDVSYINTLVQALQYHNFVPRRPVQENGQMEENASEVRKQELVAKDLQLLDECKLMVVVLLYNDPGTLIEIGYAVAKGIPTIVYDPLGIAKNCMLTELPDLVSTDMEVVITEVFINAAKLIENE